MTTVVMSSELASWPWQLGSLGVRAGFSFYEMAADVVTYWRTRLINRIFARSERQTLLDQLAVANTAQEWQEVADRLDVLSGNDLWRQNPESAAYDYKLIASRFRWLITARKTEDRAQVADLVRSGSLRNLGSIGETSLYNHAFGGTKYLIEDYIVEVIQSLDYLSHTAAEQDLTATERQKRLDFFHDTRQSYGRTALVLHGGALFGLCHIGVVKALLEGGLLPTVLVGGTIGAVVAALVCSVPLEELQSVLESVPEKLPALDRQYDSSYFGGVAQGVIRTLYPPEILVFEQYVATLLGNMTFEEAYLVSGRVLNITIVPARTGNQLSPNTVLCNYLTTPKFLIRTVMRASIGSNVVPGSDPDTVLLTKDYLGNVVPLEPGPTIFEPANTGKPLNTRDSPYLRVSELFNVNNFLVSITRPYLAPMLLSDFKYRGRRRLLHNVLSLSRTVFLYRLGQLSSMGILPVLLQRALIDENIPGSFQLVIVPEPESLVRDFALVVDTHNIREKAEHWIRIGERSVWPMSAIIWTRTAVEFALDSVYEELTSL